MASSEMSATSSNCITVSSGSRTVTGLLGFFSSCLASSVLLLDFSSYNIKVQDFRADFSCVPKVNLRLFSFCFAAFCDWSAKLARLLLTNEKQNQSHS